jgi:hypothetical protein
LRERSSLQSGKNNFHGSGTEALRVAGLLSRFNASSTKLVLYGLIYLSTPCVFCPPKSLHQTPLYTASHGLKFSSCSSITHNSAAMFTTAFRRMPAVKAVRRGIRCFSTSELRLDPKMWTPVPYITETIVSLYTTWNLPGAVGIILIV